MHDSAQALRGKKLLLVGFTLFSMFFGAGNLIFPPYPGGTGRDGASGSAFAGLCRQRHRPAHRGRGGGGPGRGAARSWPGGCTPGSRRCSPCAGLSVHRALPRHPPHSQHLVCHAHSAGGGSLVAPMGLLRPSSLRQHTGSRSIRNGSPSGWAGCSARPCWPSSCCCLRPVYSARRRQATAPRQRLTLPCPQRRASWTATRPWTPWPDSTSASSSP